MKGQWGKGLNPALYQGETGLARMIHKHFCNRRFTATTGPRPADSPDDLVVPLREKGRGASIAPSPEACRERGDTGYGRSVESRLASRLARRIMAGERSDGSRRTLMT